MDDIEKFFKKLNDKEYQALMLVYLQLKKDYKKVPGIVKLSGYKNVFRVRLGSFRLIFRVTNRSIFFLRITNRNESSYKNL